MNEEEKKLEGKKTEEIKEEKEETQKPADAELTEKESKSQHSSLRAEKSIESEQKKGADERKKEKPKPAEAEEKKEVESKAGTEEEKEREKRNEEEEESEPEYEAKKNDDFITIKLPQLKANPWMVLSLILIILTISSVLTGGFKTMTGMASSLEAAQQEGTGSSAAPSSLQAQDSEDPEVIIPITYIVDKNCEQCYDVTINKKILTDRGITVSEEKTLEYSSDEGKALVEKYDIKKIPTFILPNDALDNAWLRGVWLNVGTIENGTLVFRTPESIGDVYEQIQEDGTLKTIGLIEQNDHPVLELFVMSMCPFGVQAENGLYDVVELLKDKADFNVHYIVTELEEGFRSLHGQPETDENIRQLCVMKYAPNKFWDYLECLNPEYGNAETKWEECTTSAGIDTEEVRTCFEEEGAGLLRENIKRTREVGATGSPTIYLNGGKYGGGRAPEDFKKAVCQAFITPPEECDTVLGEETAAAQGNC